MMMMETSVTSLCLLSSTLTKKEKCSALNKVQVQVWLGNPDHVPKIDHMPKIEPKNQLPNQAK